MMSPRNVLTFAVFFTAASLSGCKSADQTANDHAVEQAKQQATASGAAQQVVTAGKDGTTTTTVVQPAAPGQTTQQVTVTKTTSSTSNATTTANTAVQPVAAIAPAATPDTSRPAQSNQPIITPVDVRVPAGTTLEIRVNQRISVKEARAGDRFTGEVVREVTSGNSVAIPRGTPVDGVIDAAHRRGHFKGRSILELRLVSMSLNGQRYSLDTADNVRTKKGKGKRSAAFIGGGTGAGMLIGGLATGGVGLVVGGLIGGGAGTALGGLTGNRDIVIPAESVVSFRLADDLAVQPQ
jgi:hypothetical protein